VKINSAADLAAILDPNHKVEGWWMFDCPECGASNPNSHYSACFDKPALVWTFTGPADLHTAREHAWRLEDWLLARDYSILRVNGWTFIRAKGEYINSVSDDYDHTAALVAAIERVSE
jgi:hypothetical protein